MAEDPKVKEYIDYIKRHPNYISNGHLDEDGFYNQPDGSFFDVEGYYFNADGYDEFGGYYDDNGVYCEEGLGEGNYIDKEDPNIEELGDMMTLQSIEKAGPKTIFTASLRNLPFKATKEQIEAELHKHGVKFSKIDLKLDYKQNLRQVHIELDDKASAKTLFSLKNASFLERKLLVEFAVLDDVNPDVSDSVILDDR